MVAPGELEALSGILSRDQAKTSSPIHQTQRTSLVYSRILLGLTHPGLLAKGLGKALFDEVYVGRRTSNSERKEVKLFAFSINKWAEFVL